METIDTGRPATNRRVWFLAAAGFFALIVAGVWLAWGRAIPLDELQRQARFAFDLNRFDEAFSLSKEILESHPSDPEALFLAGQSAEALGQFDEAIRFWEMISPEEPELFVQAQNAAGRIHLFEEGQFHLSKALACFKRAYQADPANVIANDHLAFIYGITSRYYRQLPHRMRLMEQGRFESMHLVSLALGDESLENAELIERYHSADPTDPLPYITLGRLARDRQDDRTARRHFETAISLDRDLLAAHARLGKLLFEQKDWPAFLAWLAKLPASADGHAGIWILKGDYAQEHLAPETAARCFAEAVRIDPNHSHACYQLGQILAQMGEPAKAEPFFERAKRLREYVNLVKAASYDQNLERALEAAQVAEQLKLIRESFSWAALVTHHAPRGSSAQAAADQIRSRIEPQLKSLKLVRCQPEDNPIQSLRVEDFPLPKFPSRGDSGDPNLPDQMDLAESKRADLRISFEDRAEKVGLRFRYFNGRESVENGLERMYEFGAGGVAVLDFDGDSLPDVFFSQGCHWPPGSQRGKLSDRLFRNQGDGTFLDVTDESGLEDAAFGQGVAVGDIDGDGWPDLFVANIGPNRFYRNNTDGTFTDVTTAAGISGSRWSTSAAIADLNRDGHPDLYVVNYLGDKDVFTRTCGSAERPGICLPQSFTAEQDRLYLNLGNGQFEDVTETAGIRRDDGKGLGIVVGDFEASGRLSVFIANDTTPSFLFQVPPENHASGAWKLSETALLKGLAFNREGKTESGMGVAAGDADGDGLLDLFVTNFASESNTLYRQLPTGLFEDVTLDADLHHSSLSMVGFGTQFLDADADGWQDLIVANGHIDDFRDVDHTSYKMPPQFYRNSQGVFRILGAESVGPYFQRQLLGRALAKIDWNQDGLEDAIVTHLDAPAALLTNTTRDPGGFVALKLKGVESPRDAIGTVVRATLGGRTLVRQLTAGDGYFSSNERLIHFGLADADQIDRLEVAWPSGRREVFRDVSAGSRFILIEGRGKRYSLPSILIP